MLTSVHVPALDGKKVEKAHQYTICYCAPQSADEGFCMFILSEIEDKVRVAPADLGRPVLEAVTAVIEKNYIDKVVNDVGLVITIYDITDINGGFLYPSDGAAHYDVRFKLVIFRPFPGEVMAGRLARSTRTGMFISLDFFEDVFVPGHSLPEGAAYHEDQGTWVWHYEESEMPYELHSLFRLRVKDVKFHKPPNAQELSESRDTEGALGSKDNPFVPMQVIGTAFEEGCGLASWWSAQEMQE